MDEVETNNPEIPTPDPLDRVNTGVLVVEPAETDWVAGGITGIPYEARVEDWTPYLPASERQKKRVDVLACVSFSANNVIEIQLNWLLATNRIPATALAFFNDHGYIVDGRFELSDRFLAKASGTTFLGNTLLKVWDTFRHVGAIPEHRWPFAETATWDEYYAEIPIELFELGQEFLTHVEITYEWVGRNIYENELAQLEKHVKHTPLQIVTKWCSDWLTANPVKACGVDTHHATTFYHSGANLDVLDHYDPTLRYLAKDFQIPYAMKGLITFKTPIMEQYYPQARAIVYWMYKTLLLREPESTAVLDAHAHFLAQALTTGNEAAVAQFYEGFKAEIKQKADEYIN